jgi:hypothetical protein
MKTINYVKSLTKPPLADKKHINTKQIIDKKIKAIDKVAASYCEQAYNTSYSNSM